MKKMKTIAIIAGLLFPLLAVGQDQHTSQGNKVEPFPRDLEIQLALSALPPHLRDKATVYVLNPDKGFEVAQKGTNGFHAFVARTGTDAFRGTWPLKQYRDDILFPISFDEAGRVDAVEYDDDEDGAPDRLAVSDPAVACGPLPAGVRRCGARRW